MRWLLASRWQGLRACGDMVHSIRQELSCPWGHRMVVRA